jgi:para-nitrobenzyl esterase
MKSPFIAMTLAAVLSGAGLAVASTPAAPRVEIDAGMLEGTLLRDGTSGLAFKGIPYAASPAGAWRWKPPRAAARWAGVRAAREFGSICPQTDRDVDSLRRLTTKLGGDPAWVPPLSPISEDCLSLNVFTARLDGSRPVMVWLHGGSNAFGSGGGEAAALVPYGAVVVTVNYRLGLLGFLAHPALSNESPHAASGNYGLLDQIAALQWVRRNIAAFGGDPHRVTLFGHSAGGDSVAQLLASPLARGLFHRAIIQSGGLGESRSRADMEAEGVKIASQLSAAAGDPLPTLRNLSVEKLLAASGGPFDAIADGWVLPATPTRGALAATRSGIPLVVGATQDEAAIFDLGNSGRPKTPADLRELIASSGVDAVHQQHLFDAYPASTDREVSAAMVRFMTDAYFVCPARYIAARRNAPTWLFHFTTPPTPGAHGKNLGAFHGADVRVLFDQEYGLRQNESERRVGDAMRRYWVAFAANGDPNLSGRDAWPAFGGQQPRVMMFGDPIASAPSKTSVSCSAFDEIWDRSS